MSPTLLAVLLGRGDQRAIDAIWARYTRPSYLATISPRIGTCCGQRDPMFIR